jgi:tRNA(fMet)-specific endonuclease VapC
MLRNMLDTNVCIRVLRDRPVYLRPRFEAEAETLCISTVTLAELLHGAAQSDRPAENRRQVGRFTERLTVLPFDSRAAEHAGDVRAELERVGKPIGPYGILIAGHARSLGLVVITGNLGEFRRVEGLRSEDWLAADR